MQSIISTASVGAALQKIPPRIRVTFHNSEVRNTKMGLATDKGDGEYPDRFEELLNRHGSTWSQAEKDAWFTEFYRTRWARSVRDAKSRFWVWGIPNAQAEGEAEEAVSCAMLEAIEQIGHPSGDNVRLPGYDPAIGTFGGWFVGVILARVVGRLVRQINVQRTHQEPLFIVDDSGAEVQVIHPPDQGVAGEFAEAEFRAGGSGTGGLSVLDPNQPESEKEFRTVLDGLGWIDCFDQKAKLSPREKCVVYYRVWKEWDYERVAREVIPDQARRNMSAATNNMKVTFAHAKEKLRRCIGGGA